MIDTIPRSDETKINSGGSTAVHQIDPLQDPRWAQFVRNHPMATAFHTSGWLEALRRTYGYESVVLTTTPDGEPLRNGIVLCRVRSWLTGKRLVSLPFSDHCQPLVDDPADLGVLLQYLERDVLRNKQKYGELRPLLQLDSAAEMRGYPEVSATYCIHMMDIRPSMDVLFKNSHKTAVQGMLKRAKKEALVVEKGQSEKLLKDFYRLMVITRRRHRVPPQPYSWFHNMLECLGDRATIRVAYKDGVPIASILTLAYGKTIAYKYGCSDNAHNNLGGTPLLLWNAIEEAQQQGIETLDFGRSELDNKGLISFKDRWGSARLPLHYYRYSSSPQAKPERSNKGWHIKMAEEAFSRLPDSCLILVGKLLYRHAG